MITRRVNGSQDWQFGKGVSDYAINNEAIEINIRSRILSWVGDCFFALGEGVDWRSRLDVGQKENLQNEIKSVILQSYGVVGVTSVQVSFTGSSRNILITYNIDTIYSQSFQRTLLQTIGS